MVNQNFYVNNIWNDNFKEEKIGPHPWKERGIKNKFQAQVDG